MALGIKICRVCGKEYEACHTLRPNLNGEFRWQEVACCEEHGAEYLRRVLEARGERPAEPVKEEPKKAEPPKEETPKKRTRKSAKAQEQK